MQQNVPSVIVEYMCIVFSNSRSHSIYPGMGISFSLSLQLLSVSVTTVIGDGATGPIVYAIGPLVSLYSKHPSLGLVISSQLVFFQTIYLVVLPLSLPGSSFKNNISKIPCNMLQIIKFIQIRFRS